MKALYFDLNAQYRELREGILVALGCRRGSFPHAARACDRVFSMPLFPEMSCQQVEHAANTIAEIVGTR